MCLGLLLDVFEELERMELLDVFGVDDACYSLLMCLGQRMLAIALELPIGTCDHVGPKEDIKT